MPPDLGFAVQAIVNIHSGQCFGHEVLVRGDAPAATLVERAAAEGWLADLEIAVRLKVAEAAGRSAALAEGALFVNLDPRVGPRLPEVMEACRHHLAGRFAHVVTELSDLPPDAGGEAGPPYPAALMRKGGLMLAVDRFGATRDGFALLTGCDPDFIKVDRRMIAGIDRDARQRVALAQLIGMAHTLGVEVIAVGVETARELVVCRELGLDLVQGDFVAPPRQTLGDLTRVFPHVDVMTNQDRRRRQIDQRWVRQQIDPVPAMLVDAPIREMFDRFARDRNTSYVPVVDRVGRPLGVVRESDLKNYAYSAFGKDLIVNKALGRRLQDFVVRCPIADIATPLDQMLATYAAVEDAEGILITENSTYHGFLTARSLIRAMHEKTLARARDENPLSKLPGNLVINDYVADVVAQHDAVVLAYVDFDNFKPFNDTYGFRQGDRAILLFADLCRKGAADGRWFVGHIGGDDFFVGLKGADEAEARQAVGGLIARFASDAESFYDSEARARRSITALDRDGKPREFPLLTASAVLAVLPPGHRDVGPDDISAAIAQYKKPAKLAADRIAVVYPAGAAPLGARGAGGV